MNQVRSEGQEDKQFLVELQELRESKKFLLSLLQSNPLFIYTMYISNIVFLCLLLFYVWMLDILNVFLGSFFALLASEIFLCKLVRDRKVAEIMGNTESTKPELRLKKNLRS
jgi:hypothetical protein